MSQLDSYSNKHFPWVIFLSLCIAIFLVLILQDPLAYLEELFVKNNFELPAALYTIILGISVVFSPFTIAPVVPFVAKILGPTVTFILTLIGWNVGSSIAFLLARKAKRGVVSKVYPLKRLDKNQYDLTKDPSFLRLLQTRFFAAQDYFAYYLGMFSHISYVRFLLVSILGSLPAAFIFSYSADAIADGDIVTLFVLLFATGLIAFSYLSFRGMTGFKKPVFVYVHKNSMQAGEIMAVAALKIFFQKQSRRCLIRRTNLEKTKPIEKRARKKQTIVVAQDMQCPNGAECFFLGEAGKRGNNITYGTFGSIWKKYGAAICESKLIAERLDTSLVSGVDAEEVGIAGELEQNFIEQWSLSEILEHNFVDEEITAMEEYEQNTSFFEAVHFAESFIRRAVSKEHDVEFQKNSSKNQG